MPSVIDLFAGSGGLSLGLERAGFTPVFVNELHPDAMATYVQNRLYLPVSESANQVLDIQSLTNDQSRLSALTSRLKSSFGDIDLVVGGPPCQGYSGIGHRRSFDIAKEEIPTNHLYRDMAMFVAHAAPKAFIFENVRGLLNSRWTSQGEKGEIWSDVQKAFHDVRVNVSGKRLTYGIHWQLLFAKDFGVPQNRPRVIMVGIRSDINTLSSEEFKKALEAQMVGSEPPDPIDFLGDLLDPNWVPGGSTERYLQNPSNSWHEYFRRTQDGERVLKKGDMVSEQEYSSHSEKVMLKFQHMIDNDGALPVEMKTKKFAQRLIPERWGDRGPFLTATSLADDYVHFSQPRVLTVREWARLQTFPDWYQFEGKRTTGGRRRAGDPSLGVWSRDLPKYTQIGNAVPVMLAEKIGNVVRGLI